MANLTFREGTASFYIRTQSVPRSKHLPPRLLKINLLMLYKAKVFVCSEIRTQCELNAQFLNVTTGGK
jgi:hypothetical protein